MENCANCVFYKVLNDGMLLTGQRSVVCRRYPPGGHLVMQNVGGQSMAQFIYRQAEVKPDGWCGEWQTAEPKGET